MKDYESKVQDAAMQHIDNMVQIGEQGLFTTSLVIAQAFDKNHYDVLKAISNLDCSEEFNARNFAAVEYKDAKGEMRPAYHITRDGFAFLAMGFTGKKAAAWKEKFLEAFNAMEAALRMKLAPRDSRIVEMESKANETIYPARELNEMLTNGLRGMMRMAAYLDGSDETIIEEQLCQTMNVQRIEDIRTVYAEFAFQILWHKLVLFNNKQQERDSTIEDGISALEGLIDMFVCFGTTKSRDTVKNYVLNFYNIKDFSEVKTRLQLEKLINITFMILISRFIVRK